MFNRLALLILLLLVPGYAMAMPPVITAVAAYFAVAEATVLFVAQIALTVGTSIYGAAQQRRAAQKQRDDYNAKLTDRTVTSVTNEDPYRYVYGRAKVGSTVVAIFTTGAKDEYKYLVCVHAAHECDAIEDIYVAGKLIGATDANGYVTQGPYFEQSTQIARFGTTGSSYTISGVFNASSVSVVLEGTIGDGPSQNAVAFTLAGNVVSFSNPTSAKAYVSYNYQSGFPRLRAIRHRGNIGDAADAALISEFPGQWTANHTLTGFCYTVLRLDLLQPEFQSGIPSVEVVLRGKKLYDPRTGVTAFSFNPALAIYDYLTSELCGVPVTDIPLANVIAAANVCDEGFTFGPVSGARYTISGVVTSDQPQAGVLEKMAQCMAGGLVSTTWEMYAGKYIAPTVAIQQSDIVGSVAITPGVSDASLFNGVKGQYTSPEMQYVPFDIKPYQNATYAAADGRDLFTNIDFPFTDSLARVYNLSRVFVEDQRNGYTVKATFSMKAWGLKIGQRVTLTSSLFGWNAKVFRITDKGYSPSSMIELTLKEDVATIWDAADAVTIDNTPNTDLPNPFYVAPLAGFKARSDGIDLLLQGDGSVVSRIYVSWLAATSTARQIDLEWSSFGSTVWDRLSVGGTTTSAYLTPVLDGLFYNVRGRSFDPTFNVAGDWAYSVVAATGKSAPPADIMWITIEGSTLTWAKVGDIDLAGYILRFHYGTNRSWGDANPLHSGLITTNPYTLERLPQGPITLMVKAVDTSGNESGTAAFILTQLGDVIVDNVVQTWDFKALGYPGTLVGGALTSGSLRANGSSFFYGADGADIYKTGDAQPFYVDNYLAMIYETSIITPTAAGIGSMMTFNTGITGNAIFIEYRLAGNKPMFSTVGTDPFYGDGVTSFYGQPDVYQPWPGQVAAKNQQYQFRISIGQSSLQGVIDACNVVVDLPDRLNNFNNVAIGSAGTRLALSSPFNVIKNVQVSLQYDGGTAVRVDIVDKNPTAGPLIRCLNAAGSQVTGTLDAIVQGY